MLEKMTEGQISAWREGFRKIGRHPFSYLFEVGWRWTFGGVLLAILALSAAQFLHSVHVTEAESSAMHSHNPLILAAAAAEILRGTGPRLLKLAAVLVPSALLGWTAAITLGRAATLWLLADEKHSSPEEMLFPFLGLNFLRATTTLAALAALYGSTLIAAHAALAANLDHPNYALFYVVLLALWVAVGMAWSVVSWYLALAPVFIAVEGAGSLQAMAEALRISRRRRAEMSGITMVFFAFKLLAVAIAIGLSALPFLAPQAGVLPILVALIAIMLLYFLAADWLYLARLGAYVALVERELRVESMPATATGH